MSAKQTPKPKTPRPKLPRCHGRVRATVDGKQMTVELRDDGLRIRKFHCRTVRVVTLKEIANWGKHQMDLFPNFTDAKPNTTSVPLAAPSQVPSA